MKIQKFESFRDDLEFEEYYHLVEDILILEKTEGSVDNPSSPAAKSLKKKAKRTGISFTTLKKVYKRGSAAWNSGHKPGTPQQAWAMGRVNSFITGEGGARDADSDLWKGAKKKRSRKRTTTRRGKTRRRTSSKTRRRKSRR